MKDGACVNNGNNTTSDELQHVLTLDSKKHNKCIVIEWLLGKYHYTHNRSNCLNLFIFEITSEWCFDDSRVQGIWAFKTLSIALWLNCEKLLWRVNLKKFSSGGCLDKNTSSMGNQIIKGLHNPCMFHSHGVESWFNKCTDIVRSIVFQHDVAARENIDMCDGGFEEHFGYSILWLACNDQLEHLQVVGLNPMLEHIQEALTLLDKNYSTYNRINYLNLFLFEITSKWYFDDSKVQGI